MLICDKCGTQIPESSRFCPQCADPVTEADRMSKPVKKAHSRSAVAEGTEQIKLVCPKCEAQSLYEIVASRSVYNLKCPKCRTDFTSRIVKIRAKRSRGSKKENKRRFSVRVIDFSGSEGLIEFVNAGYGDFELRAKDIAAFSYRGNKVRMVQNLTIGQYMTVSEPKCYLATYLYGSTSEVVTTLRLFRDDVLLDSVLFSPIVTLYYWMSPALIRWLGDNRLFRAVSLALINPVVGIVDWYLRCTSRAERAY